MLMQHARAEWERQGEVRFPTGEELAALDATAAREAELDRLRSNAEADRRGSASTSGRLVTDGGAGC
jgi:hypothetical protein